LASSWPRARLVKTADQAITAAPSDIVWDAATYDSHGGWDPTTPTDYVVRRGGLFWIAYAAIRGAPSASSGMWVALTVNGAI